MGLRHLAERGLHIGTTLAESAKILILQEHSSCPVHLLEVEGIMQFAGVMAQEGRLLCMQEVMIGARGGREACVQIVGHSFYPLNGDVAWQQLIELVGQLPGVHLFIDIEVGHHHGSMYSGIRTSCSHGLYGLAQE